jgi:hypothetical protein
LSLLYDVISAVCKKIQSNLQENQELEQTANKIAETIQVLKNERIKADKEMQQKQHASLL